MSMTKALAKLARLVLMVRVRHLLAVQLPTHNVQLVRLAVHIVTPMTKAHALRAQPVLLDKVRRLLALRPQILNVLDAQMEAHTVT
jgi:hypothetical protein